MNCLRISPMLFASALLAAATVNIPQGAAAGGAAASCSLGNGIKHVIHLTFDNVHLRRDNPNVPSDLEQMPHLLNFLQDNGIVSGNHHTPLISHTAHDITTALTGVYGARSGIPVANSYGFFRPDGSVGFSSSFLYWTAPSGGTPTAGDGQPEMISKMVDGKGVIAPAPWVPFTRAGCNVGAFSVANIEFETVPNDVTTVFGAGSSQDVSVRAQLASTDAATKTQPSADYLGISIHCAQGSALCNNAHAAPDNLPDEPGGYTGFKALYGNINVQPVISPGGPVKDLDGNVIANAFGHPGFPNSFNPLATQSLGYVAAMLEAGVQVVYFYIADAHDNHSASGGTFGPGEAGYVAQLASYDAAFAKFFARLAADGITKDNTLFVITADENDHFVGAPPTPSNCDGVTTPCSWIHSGAGTNIGEIDVYIDRLLLTQRNNTTPFSVHSDDAPVFYIVGNPKPTDAVTRTLEKDVNALTTVSPLTGKTDKLSVLLADQAEMNLLHMITASPARNPSFTMFGDPDYFFETSGSSSGQGTTCANAPPCVFESSGFAWNHGDFQTQITRTWFGMVGPGVKVEGRNDSVFSDHTDLRPTVMALLGLTDDYVHDGRVLAEDLRPSVLPPAVKGNLGDFIALAQFYKQINAPLGSVGRLSLSYANRSITGSDAAYAGYLAAIGGITAQRNSLAAEMVGLLNDAAFNGKPIKDNAADPLISSAFNLIEQVRQLQQGGLVP